MICVIAIIELGTGIMIITNTSRPENKNNRTI